MLAFRRAKSFQIFRFFDFFGFSNFSILNLEASNPSTLAHSYVIQTPVDGQYGRSKAPELGYTSYFHVVASTSLSLRFGHVEKETLASCETGNARWNLAGNERPNWLSCM